MRSAWGAGERSLVIVLDRCRTEGSVISGILDFRPGDALASYATDRPLVSLGQFNSVIIIISVMFASPHITEIECNHELG